MIINVKASSSSNFGNYLTNREKEAFTIIEGDPKRIDSLAATLLEDKKNRKNTHYSFVLSFKETSLTKDDLFNYYMQFKEQMFKNYNVDELEILSVIHWDDVKPHIHCTVLNASQLDNGRDLRLYRGYVDFKRVEAVQEKINYENNLVSPFDNYNLLSLTKEQKARDWLVKKGKPSYDVFDDEFFRVVEQSIKKSKDFASFMAHIEDGFGATTIHAASKFNKDEFNKNKILNEYALVLKDKFLPTGQNYVYSSKLFDKSWFEKNLLKIQDSLSRVALENIKFSADKKSPKEYERILQETTKKHAEHILARRVGQEYVVSNIDRVLDENLALFKAGSLSGLNKEVCESIIERFLENCDDKQLEKFTLAFPYSFEIKKEYILYKKNDTEVFNIYNQSLVSFLGQKGVSSRNTKNLDAPSTINKIEIKDFQELLLNLNSNKNRAKFRSLFLKLLEQERIKNLKEFEDLLKKLDLKIVKSGSDTKRGNYVTLENNYGKVSVYDVFLASIAKNEVFPEETLYLSARDKEINSEVLASSDSYYIKSVYSKLVEKVEAEAIDCVDDFRLHKSPHIGSVVEENGFIYTQSYIEYANVSKNSYERVLDNKNGSLDIEKTLNCPQTGENIADFYSKRGVKDIYIDDKAFDKEVKKGIIRRIEEMDYSLSLWDKYPSYINGTSLLYTNKGKSDVVEMREPVVEPTVAAPKTITEQPRSSVTSDGSKAGKQEENLSERLSLQ